MIGHRFIVSTGRCGSTLLSSLLGDHPSVLNISELFAAVQPGAFPSGPIPSDRFWTMLSQPQPVWTVALRHRLEPPEFRYPIDGGGRFDRATGVAPVAGVCLPTVSETPDLLYRELEDLVLSFPSAEPGQHYRLLFDWLAARLGKEVWVERSGGSLPYAGAIAERFEGAKFVHLYRNGGDTALSMSRHTFFRMAVVREMLTAAIGHDPFEKGRGPPVGASITPDLATLLPDTFDPRAFRELPIPLERFGRRWSAMILHGVGQLALLPPADVFHLSYESFLARPEASLGRIVDFFELSRPSAEWFASASARVMRGPPQRLPLSPAQRQALVRVCAPGELRLSLLARSG